MKTCSLVTVLLTCAACLLQGQTYTPRVNYGARLEPKNGIIHGAGQSPDANAAYWSVMPVGRQPMVYMYYIGLDTLTANWANNLKAQLLLYTGGLVMPQIGLSLTEGVNAHYEQQVSNGMYDTQIGYLIAGLRTLATPAYLRIGYEFNGLTWNGYQPAPYVQAFIHITNALRAAADLEVATVWDASIDGVTNYSDYYPGDSYVDWFGMNVFTDSSFTNPNLPVFMALSDTHKKPVMVGETTPELVGAQNGAASWSGWYADFFKFLQKTPEVKMFNYIDWDWSYWSVQDNQPSWSNWGDSRLETPAAAYVLNLYTQQMADPIYLHTMSESSFRSLLGYPSSAPPTAVTGLSAAAAPGGASVTWSPVTDTPGIARYYIYRNNTLLDFALAPPYTDLGASLGNSTYGVVAMDRAGSFTPLATTSVTLNSIERMINGNFENGLTGWQFESYNAGAVGSAVIDTTNPIDGTASVKVTVTQTTGTNWHLQLQQPFQMTSGLTYNISFKARSSAPVTLPFLIQQVGGASAIYLNQTASLTPTAATFQYSFTANTTQSVVATYLVADIGSATVWIDDVSVQESNPGAALPSVTNAGVVSGASFAPGVVPQSWVAIQGANLSPVAADTWASQIQSGKLPASLDGVSVSIGGQPAYVYFVSPGQLNVLAPTLGPGQVQLTVTTPAGTSAPVTVNVAGQAPAFFAWPGNQPVATRQDGSYAAKANTFAGLSTAAAKPGDVLILWGTGFGATSPAAPDGVPIPATNTYNCSPVTITLGTVNAPVYGCALSPGSAGLYQVAIQVPSTMTTGNYALQATVNGALSPGGVILSVQQ